MYLKQQYEEKFRIANDKLNELFKRKEQGEDIIKNKFDEILEDTLGSPDPLVQEMMVKIFTSEKREEEDVINQFKKLNVGYRFITIEGLKLGLRMYSLETDDSNQESFDKQMYWLKVLEKLV